MQAKLITHTFPDDPDWELVSKEVPLGTVYEVFGFDSRLTVLDLETGKARDVACYYVFRPGTGYGFLPCICLEAIKES